MGIILISQLLLYPLPHDSNPIIKYIIPEIKFKNGSVIYISGILPLILIIKGINGLSKIEKFKYKSKFLMFMAVLIIVNPLVTWSMDTARKGYHYVIGDELNALDIKESNISLSSLNNNLCMKVDLQLKNYGKKESKFKIRVYLPKSIREYTNKEYYELDNSYSVQTYPVLFNINEVIDLHYGEYPQEKLRHSNWYNEDVVYELYNDEETIKIIRHGL